MVAKDRGADELGGLSLSGVSYEWPVLRKKTSGTARIASATTAPARRARRRRARGDCGRRSTSRE
jgi:hypothetical protein